MKRSDDREWDVFLSYASEDRDTVARPLVDALETLGISVWYDEKALEIGDSLRRTIDNGLRKCRFGIVILSPSFFGKHYPNRELDGLAQKEVGGEKVILPVWHQVNAELVLNYSPPLADRVAARWEEGPLNVAWKIMLVCHPEVPEQLEQIAKKTRLLKKLESGQEVVGVLDGAFAYNFAHDEVSDEAETELVAGFLQELQDWGEILSDLEIGERVRAESSIQTSLEEMRNAGWRLFGRQMKQRVAVGGASSNWPVATAVLVRSDTEEVFEVPGGGFGFFRSGAESGGSVDGTDEKNGTN